MARTTRWRLAVRGEIEAARFADGALVFNPLSWDTHLLNPQAMDLLDALREAPCSTVALAGRLAQAGGAGDFDETLVLQVAETLAELEALGLVGRTSTHAPA